MSGFRLPAGGRIDRTRTLRFRFDGRDYTGHPGDTLASALLANGVHLMGRSFKYHRPRGPIAIGRGGAERAGHDRHRRAPHAELPRDAGRTA